MTNSGNCAVTKVGEKLRAFEGTWALVLCL